MASSLGCSSHPSPSSLRPASFNMLYAHGVGEVPISISGDPNDSSMLHHTIRVVGNVTQALGSHSRLATKSEFVVRLGAPGH